MVLVSQVCHSYNNGTGEYGRCPDAENCRRLHICEKYLRGSCDCSRAHDFYEPHPLKTLQDRGIPTELMAILKDLYSNIEALRSLSKAASGPNAAGPNPRRGPNAQNRRPSSGFNAGRGQDAQRFPQNNTGNACMILWQPLNKNKSFNCVFLSQKCDFRYIFSGL